MGETWTSHGKGHVISLLDFLHQHPYREHEEHGYAAPAVYQAEVVTKRRERVLELMDILEMRPLLVGDLLYPLHAILKAATCVDLDLIQRFHRICGPKLQRILETRDRGGDFPLHLACEFCSGDVIEYLLCLKPEVASMCARYQGCLPLQTVTYNSLHPPSLSAWKALIRFYPQAIAANRNMCLQQALNQNFYVEFLDLLASEFPKETKEVWIRDVEGRFTLEKVRVLCKLLPQLKKLWLYCNRGWSREMFLYFLEQLKSNNTLKALNQLQIPRWMRGQEATCEEGCAGNYLRQALRSNTCLENLCINARYADIDNMQSILMCLHLSLADTNIERNRRKVAIAFSIADENDGIADDSTLVKFRMEGRSQTVEIIYNRFDWSSKDLVRVMQQQPKLFGLTNVYLEASIWHPDTSPLSKEDFTAALKGMVKESQNVESMQLVNFSVDISGILVEIMTHSKMRSFGAYFESTQPNGKDMEITKEDTLVCLSYLKQKNETLQELYPWQSNDPRVRYLLKLNASGRGRVRKASDPSVLVGLLSNIMLEYEKDEEAGVDEWIVGMVYGLLREAPGLWSSVGLRRARKRKRP